MNGWFTRRLKIRRESKKDLSIWSNAGVQYRVGRNVLYNGVEYHCIMEHVSAAGSEPGIATTLWVIGVVGKNTADHAQDWQSLQTDLVHIGGVPQSVWDGTISDFAGYTILLPAWAFRQAGSVSRIVVYVNSFTGASWLFKVWRYNPATLLYDLVNERSFTPAATGAQTFNITPISVSIGDIPSLYSPAGNNLRLGNPNPTVSPLVSRNKSGNVVTSDAFVSTGANNCKLDCLGTAPYLTITGDSIPEGHNGASNYHGGLHPLAGSILAPGLVSASEPGYELRTKIGDGAVLKYQNLALGSETFAWVASTGIVQCIAAKPHSVLIHCGVNDVSTGRTWNNVLADLNTILAAVNAATPVPKLLIDEILPWTGGSDAQAATIRTFNTNIAAWCATNGAVLILCHDAFAQTRPSTGQLDDLLTAYNQDNVHLTIAGVNKLAETWARYI